MVVGEKHRLLNLSRLDCIWHKGGLGGVHLQNEVLRGLQPELLPVVAMRLCIFQRSTSSGIPLLKG